MTHVVPLLSLAVLLSLDGFFVCIGVGPIVRDRQARYGLAIAFGCADAGAGWLGAQLTGGVGVALPWASVIVPVVIAAYGAWVLTITTCARTALYGRPFWMLVPALLAVDNAVAGASTGQLHSPSSMSTIAAVSALMAFAGLALGAKLSRVFRMTPSAMAGWGLLVGAAFALVT